MKVSLSLCMHLCVSMSPSSFRGIDVFELQLHVLFKRFLKLCLIFPSLRSAFTCTAPSFTRVCVCVFISTLSCQNFLLLWLPSMKINCSDIHLVFTSVNRKLNYGRHKEERQHSPVCGA